MTAATTRIIFVFVGSIFLCLPFGNGFSGFISLWPYFFTANPFYPHIHRFYTSRRLFCQRYFARDTHYVLFHHKSFFLAKVTHLVRDK